MIGKRGKNIILGQYVTIGQGCIIGDDCLLQGHNQLGGFSELGKRVTMKCGSIITGLTQLGDDVFVGPNAICLGPCCDGVKTVIGDRVYLGAGALVDPGVSICSDVKVGVLTYVKSDITKPGTYVGIPARQIK